MAQDDNHIKFASLGASEGEPNKSVNQPTNWTSEQIDEAEQDGLIVE